MLNLRFSFFNCQMYLDSSVEFRLSGFSNEVLWFAKRFLKVVEVGNYISMRESQISVGRQHNLCRFAEIDFKIKLQIFVFFLIIFVTTIIQLDLDLTTWCLPWLHIVLYKKKG
jgi:hypothetical protein